MSRPPKATLPRGRPVIPREGVDHRRLPGPVGSDQAMNLALADDEVDVGDRDDPAVGHAQTADL